ncbi:MAG: hypothetical protein F6K36_07205 [Symploca sp. SIO3C6]|uniref:Uncharacterized protein n=1 Tax=Symploca sp. SIO1C4 TaxID=2607765 RepID=A0A6B3NKJ0_9CYAN|nr:hypothetical protein [Symploca sp. SIO3C6]NER30972.1 hypothetical protein [Symploca sp. SIO1C4]
MSELEEAVKFIKSIERKHSGKSTYEIANILRGYTRKAYTTRLWNTATGYDQEYISGEFEGKLNPNNLVVSGEVTDFGHFIAALSDQINQPGIKWSDLNGWTGDYSSWSGDIGSAIVVFRSQYENIRIQTLEEGLNRFARDSDYAADIAAYVVGSLINSRRIGSISQAIIQYDYIPYLNHVRTFIKKRFGTIIKGNSLQRPAILEAQISRSVANLIRFSNIPELWESVQDYLQSESELEFSSLVQPSRSDLLKGSLHFLTHIVNKGGLNSLRFKPYQIPAIPWLGTFNYQVSV